MKDIFRRGKFPCFPRLSGRFVIRISNEDHSTADPRGPSAYNKIEEGASNHSRDRRNPQKCVAQDQLPAPLILSSCAMRFAANENMQGRRRRRGAAARLFLHFMG
jgi:hypothetical protein